MFDKKIADIAFKQDRERFFKEADKYEMISYLRESLSDEQKKRVGASKNRLEKYDRFARLSRY